MKFDAQLRGTDLGQVADKARWFERVGFDAVWTFEAAQDPFLPLAVSATATTRLDLGTNIAVAFARSPFATAQLAWDLQKASRGRFHLGLGTQVRAHVERRFSAAFEHPAARVTDYIRCVRAIWETFQTDARPDHQGPFYQFRLMNPMFNPGPIDHPEIPVYLAGVNPRMCRAAGEVADGFHVHPMHSVGYLRDVVRPALNEGAALSGKTVDDMTLYASIFQVSGETEQERSAAEAEVRRQISFYASTPSYRALLEYHGFDGLGKELSQLMRQGDLAAMPRLVPDALLDEVAVAARLADLPGKLRQRYQGLLQRVGLYATIPDDAPEDTWSAFINAFRAPA